MTADILRKGVIPLVKSLYTNELSDFESLLNEIILSLRKKRPKVDLSLPYTAFPSNRMLQIWINTPACRFSLAGKCSICDYWDGTGSEQAVIKVCEYIEQVGNGYDMLLLDTCGSCFCEEELPYQELIRVMHTVAKTSIRCVIIESHLAYVTVEKMQGVKEVLTGKEVFLEYGQESTSPYVLKYCLNKPSMSKQYSIIHDLKRMGVGLIANVVLGIPFLTVQQRVNDSTESIRRLLDEGIDGVVLFPVNIKPYTLVRFLYDHGYYKQVNAIEILEVLDRFGTEELSRIELAWFEPQREKLEAYGEKSFGVYYCPECGKKLLEKFLDYKNAVDGIERKRILRTARSEVCDCVSTVYDYPFPNVHDTHLFMKKVYEENFYAAN